MEPMSKKPRPLWAYPAAIALLAILVYLQQHYFVPVEAVTGVMSSSH
jgi:hypothetical protein